MIDLKDHDVLEIGCGTGLAGMYCAAACSPKRMVFTDHIDDLLRNVHHNLSENAHCFPQVESSVCKLDWNKPRQMRPMSEQGTYEQEDITPQEKTFQRIIAADICYDVPSTILAVDTIHEWIAPSAVVYVVLPVRKGFDKELETFERCMREKQVLKLDTREVISRQSFSEINHSVALDIAFQESEQEFVFFKYSR